MVPIRLQEISLTYCKLTGLYVHFQMASSVMDNILKQLYPYLAVHAVANNQYNYVSMKSLWEFFNKPFGFPVKITISRNETVIIYFHPLIQRLQIKIDQQTIIYEIGRGQDDEMDINAQIQEIQEKYPVLDTLKQQDIRENSYIIIKWIPLNHLQNIKIKSRIFGYYALQSLEIDQQIQWFNRNQQELYFYMRKVYQFRPKAFKFTITPIPSQVSKDIPQTSLLLKRLSKRDEQFSIPNYFYKNNDGVVVHTERPETGTKQVDQGFQGFNKFMLSKNKEIDAQALLVLHNFIVNNAEGQKFQTTFQFWINIMGYQCPKTLFLEQETLKQEIVQHVEHQLPPKTYGLDQIYLLANILYYHRIYKQYNDFYGNKNLCYQIKKHGNSKSGKKDRNANQSNSNSILQITRPFIMNNYNNQQTQDEFDTFILGIDQPSIDNAIKLFEVMILNKFTQQFDDTCKLNISGNLFTDDSEEYNIVNSDMFQIIENIRSSDTLKDHILRQKREYSNALYKYNPKMRDKVLLMQRLHDIRIEVDMKDKQIQELDKIFFRHYNQYLNELIINGYTQQNNIDNLSNINIFRTELTAAGKAKPLYYQQLVKNMYKNISPSGLHKQLQQSTDNAGLDVIKDDNIKQLAFEYYGYLTAQNESLKQYSILDKIYNYLEIFQWIVLHKRTKNVIYISQIGYQVTQQDDIIEVDEDELQMNKEIIQAELGHVYGLESQEIKYVVGGLPQPQVVQTASKFKLRDMPSK